MLALGEVRPARAVPRDAQVAECEVVFDRILRIELSQRGRDLLGGRPTRSAAIGQTEVPADAVDVRVDGNQECRGGDGPEAKVDSIGAANHPAGIEHEALASAAGSGVANQMTQAAASRVAAKCIGKTCEAFAKISVARPMEPGKRVAEASLVAQQRPCTRQHRCEVLPPINAVGEPPKPMAKLHLIGAGDDSRRVWPESREQSIDASPCGYGVSKCQTCRDQADDFLVTRLMITVHEVDWVSPTRRLCAACGEQFV